MSARQRAGTLERVVKYMIRRPSLERVVKYDKEAFTKAWDYLARSDSDGEDDQRFFFCFLFSDTFWIIFSSVFFLFPDSSSQRG